MKRPNMDVVINYHFWYFAMTRLPAMCDGQMVTNSPVIQTADLINSPSAIELSSSMVSFETSTPIMVFLKKPTGMSLPIGLPVAT